MARSDGIGDPDSYFKKVVSLEHEGHSLRFRVAQDLFSSHEVDVGTRLLLRTLEQAGHERLRKVLDLGCGYGPLGLALKKADQRRAVHMVDRDALAVEYARQNAELNGVPDVEVYGTLGYEDVRGQDFDLIMSNIPGKAGESLVKHILLGGVNHLRPGGLVAVVVVSPLARTVLGLLDEAPHVEVVFQKATPSYTVFHYRFTADNDESPRTTWDSVTRGVYRRKTINVQLGEVRYSAETAYGLPEFDSPSFQSRLLVDALNEEPELAVGRALVLNPGQGHLALSLWKLSRPDHVVLMDRDLLALRYSRRNLVLNGCPDEHVTPVHRPGIVPDDWGEIDVVVGGLREDLAAEHVALALGHLAGRMSSGGRMLVAARSTTMTRVVKGLRSEKRLRVEMERRRRGNVVVVLRAAKKVKRET